MRYTPRGTATGDLTRQIDGPTHPASRLRRPLTIDERDHGNDDSREHRHTLIRHPLCRDQRQERCDRQQGREEVVELSEKANHGRGSCEALDAVGSELGP